MPMMSCAIRSGCCDCYAVRLVWTLPTPCCHGRQVRARPMECGQSIGMPKWNARRRSHRIASEKSKCRRVCMKYTRAAAKFTKSSINIDCVERCSSSRAAKTARDLTVGIVAFKESQRVYQQRHLSQYLLARFSSANERFLAVLGMTWLQN